MDSLDPYLSLALALRAVPGAYAVLLGAGVSVSAGIPAAWQVQQQLIEDLARAKGIALEGLGPDVWWRAEFGVEATYDGVLGALAHTAAERQGLLRPFFEPTDEDREVGEKVPSAAHRAVAELVAGGYVRVVLTTNFDFLIEAAIREKLIEPVVLSSPEAIAGVMPLSHLGVGQCVVVHLHGDYLSDKLLNTADELGTYPADTDRLLDRVLDEYGLVIAGWSGRWDAALRKAILRAPGRRFATYWIDPAPHENQAQQLAAHRAAVHVRATADEFLPQVAEACRSLEATGRRHPLTVHAAVATAKRELAGGRVGIPLHAIRAEAAKVSESSVVNPPSWNPPDLSAVHLSRLTQLEADCEVLAALVATTAYWGDAASDRWWFDLAERLSKNPLVGGSSSLIGLARAPGVIVAYAAGVAACAAGRDDLVASLLVRVRSETDNGLPGRLLEVLSTEDVLGTTRSGERLHNYLKPLIADHLGRGAGYTDDWDRWELLTAVAMMDGRQRGRSTGNQPIPYVRVRGFLHDFHSLAGEQLRNEVTGPSHSLLAGGFCDGDAGEFQAVLDRVDRMTSATVTSSISSRMVEVTELPSGPIYSY